MSIGNGLLIVEDEGVVALDLRTSLESLGYRVLGVCANADDAVRSAEALRPDLVLMDIHLDGDVPGTEAARVIRERFQIPSIFLTAYAEEDMLRNAESSAPYGYLLKPYQLRELNASVRMGLARRRAEREEERQRRRLRMAVEAARLGCGSGVGWRAGWSGSASSRMRFRLPPLAARRWACQAWLRPRRWSCPASWRYARCCSARCEWVGMAWGAGWSCAVAISPPRASRRAGWGWRGM